MTQEAYVSFEVAKLLKEKGFDWNCYAVYGRKGELHRYTDKAFNNGGLQVTSAPTQQMACRWLREEKDIDVLPECSLVDRKYPFLIINRYSTGGEIIHGDELFDKYEDAIEAALEYCLTELI